MEPAVQPLYDQTSPAWQWLIGQAPVKLSFGLFSLHIVLGVPSAALGANNDYALRGDGAAGANTTLYHKEAGAWVACTL
jgi:hypothetical protein